MMQTRQLMPVALFSAALLAGCGGGGGGGGGGSRVENAASDLSLSAVDPAYRDAVRVAKTFKMDLDPGETVHAFSIDGQSVPDSGYDLSALERGLLAPKPYEINYTWNDNGTSRAGTAKGNLRIYNQAYSVVLGFTASEDSAEWIAEPDELNHPHVFVGGDVLGLNTTAAFFNTLSARNVRATYTGTAFTPTEQGTLNYTVNFGDRTGEGSITGINRTGRIDLLKADVTRLPDGFVGVDDGNARLARAPSQGAFHYGLGLFGPEAEEIVGAVYGDGRVPANQDAEVVFGGTRGALVPN